MGPVIAGNWTVTPEFIIIFIINLQGVMIDLESYVRAMRARSIMSKHAHKPTVRTADIFISWKYFKHFYDGNICGGLNVENRHTPLASSDSTDLLSISEAAFLKKKSNITTLSDCIIWTISYKCVV